MKTSVLAYAVLGGLSLTAANAAGQLAEPKQVVVLHAVRLLDVATGSMITPGEGLVRGDPHR